MNMRVTPGQVSVDGGSNTPDPIQELKNQLKAKLATAVSNKDVRVKSLDVNVITQGEFSSAVEEAKKLLTEGQAKYPDNVALKAMTVETLVAQTLQEKPALAESLSKSAAHDAANMLNTSDVFEDKGTRVLQDGTYQVALDLNQDGKLDEKDKALNFNSAVELQRNPSANADRITHWYDTQKGQSIPAAGSAVAIAANQRAMEKAEAAAKKAEADRAYQERFGQLQIDFKSREAEWKPLVTSGNAVALSALVNKYEIKDASTKDKMDAVLPYIFGRDDLVSQLDHQKARGLAQTGSLPTIILSTVGTPPERYGFSDIYGRMFFRVSQGNTLPAGLTNGMTVDAYKAAIQLKE